MHIKNHKLVGVETVKARDVGCAIEPKLVVLHDTAGRLEARNSVRWLSGNPGKSSVHFVVERDGEIVQMVPTNRRANHAGKSNYHGRAGVNGFSIGIEIVNPGRMRALDENGKRVETWYGEAFDAEQYRVSYCDTEAHGAGWWMGYPEAQVLAVQNLLAALFEGVPGLSDIRTHWYVSPGRKVDTNPLFPLDQIRARILGRDDPIASEADDSASKAEPGKMVLVNSPGDSLNMRAWPSFNPNVIAAIPDGVRLPVLRAGIFDGRQWLKVAYAGLEGWIVKNYTKGED